MDELIERWLVFCSDKQKCFDEFFKAYEEQIGYIYSPNTLFEKKYEGEYLIPVPISENILHKLELDEKLSLYKLEKCTMKTDFLQEEKIVTDSTGNTLENYSIEDISGEDVNVPDGEFFALVDENEKKIYVGLQVKYYSLMIEKIRQINSALTNNADAKKVNETDIENVAERMACFKDAFDDIHPGIPIESVTSIV